jgi:hypothetical protein
LLYCAQTLVVQSLDDRQALTKSSALIQLDQTLEVLLPLLLEGTLVSCSNTPSVLVSPCLNTHSLSD